MRGARNQFARACSIAVLYCAAATGVAQGAPPGDAWRERVTLMFSDRMRGEFVDWFEPLAGKAAPGAQRYDFFANQLRLGAKVNLPHVLFVAEMQDTRLVNLPGDATPPAVAQGGALGPGAVYFLNTRSRDQGEPFLKQGNFTLQEIPGMPGVSFTGGRFEYADGGESIPTEPGLAWLKRERISQRLVGPFGYTHVTRSLDGARLVYDTAQINVTGFGSRPTQGGFEVSANPELDIWLAGLALTLKQIEGMAPLDARGFYLYYRDNRDDAPKVDNRPAPARSADRRDIAVHTWGGHAIARVDAGPGKADGLLWAAVQAGDWGKLDHVAWAYAIEAGYQLPDLPAAPWLRLGYWRSSGDDNPGDTTHETFFQILPTARAYAQFPFFNLMNNEDLFAQCIAKPHERVTLRADYHWLRLTEPADLWYSGGGATNDTVFGFAGLPSSGRRELAHLVDVGLTVSLLQHLSAYAYYGRAFGQGVVQGLFGGSDANYGYLETTLRF